MTQAGRQVEQDGYRPEPALARRIGRSVASHVSEEGEGLEISVTASGAAPHSQAGAVFLYFTPLTLLVFLALPN